MGDGKWGFNTNEGFIKSETNKLYKISELNYDIIHVVDEGLRPVVESLYPKADVFYQKKKYNSDRFVFFFLSDLV